MTKIKIGMVGLNWGVKIIDEHLLAGPASPWFQLAAVCQRDRTKADAVAAKYGVKAYYSIDDIIADPDIPAIALMTGPAGRAEQIRKIIDAGKHVITTKPFEVDSQAAIEVLQRARELKRAVHLNSPTPLLSPDLRQIALWREELNLGRPVAVRADIWSNYRETPDGGWYDDPAQCPVAPIFRLGIYLINDLVRMLGDPESVSVMHSRLFTGRPTPDNAQLSIKFKNGAIANVFASFCVNDAQWWLSTLTMNFENGTVYRNIGPVSTATPREHPEMAVVVQRDGKPVTQKSIACGSTEDYQWEAFHGAVLGEDLEGEITPEEITAGLRVIDAMSRAENSGRTEPIL